jgi:hypothetical protein
MGQAPMTRRQCFHCKQWIEPGDDHDCWTTTEAALTKNLSQDLRDAWERLRETVVEFGEQRIYASHHSIMFARKACYAFVRPQRKRLEVVFFAGRAIKSPLVHKVVRTSKVRLAHMVHVIHRDQVEAPFTDWLQEAYALQDAAMTTKPSKRKKPAKQKATPVRKSAPRRRAKR